MTGPHTEHRQVLIKDTRGDNSKLKGTVSAAYSRSNNPGCTTLVDISGLFKENVDGRGVDSPPMQLRLRSIPILNSP
ncbi:hypothetical protein BACT_1396 [Bifidobacterium actinocoloniiforme DSM 22766]|uniref:Uncharacterized protein n=1 Tax=Bifidobacterium actinocoloniiforme DSM 22766 TaxID=1437605 RepID=A0A086Z2E2_9BIFI|nr:hypothetical protein BACT_1396 [Bifidobacterium actinocoloniiforme DSM 22766]